MYEHDEQTESEAVRNCFKLVAGLLLMAAVTRMVPGHIQNSTSSQEVVHAAACIVEND